MTTPSVRFLTSSSLRAISAARAGGRIARGGASGSRGSREEGRSGTGEGAESTGWSGGSDDTSDVETEEEGWVHDTLTELPWGTQENGARGLRVDALAGGSEGRKSPSATANEAGTRGRHGMDRGKGRKTEAGGNWRGENPREWGETMGDARPPEWTPRPT